MATAKRAPAARTPVTIDQPAEGTPNLPVSIAEAMQKELAEMNTRVSAPTGDTIRVTQDKKFKFPDNTEHEGPIEVVVIEFAYGNTFYDQPYREGENISPACFARGLSQRELVPSKNAPEQQSETCGSCPNNEFGSSGAGKACANNAFLAVVQPGESENPEILILKVSPTAVKAWDGYIHSVKNTQKMPPYGVITEVYFDPNSKYSTLRFGNPSPNPNTLQHFGLKAQARERLLAEPDVSNYAAPVKAPARKAGVARR